MYPEHAECERVIVVEQHIPVPNRRTSPLRYLWCYRISFLLVLMLFGLHLFATESNTGSEVALMGQRNASSHTDLVSGNGSLSQIGLGAGANTGGMTNVSIPVASCINPLDATCWLQNAAQWMAQQIMGALQPVIGAIMRNPLNILTQTPPADTYQNPTVITWWHSFLAVICQKSTTLGPCCE